MPVASRPKADILYAFASYYDVLTGCDGSGARGSVCRIPLSNRLKQEYDTLPKPLHLFKMVWRNDLRELPDVTMATVQPV